MGEQMPSGSEHEERVAGAGGELEVAEAVTRIAVAWLSNPQHQLSSEDLPTLLHRIAEGLSASTFRQNRSESKASQQAG